MIQTVTIDGVGYTVDRTVAGMIDDMQDEINALQVLLTRLAAWIGGEPCWCDCEGGEHSNICRDAQQIINIQATKSSEASHSLAGAVESSVLHEPESDLDANQQWVRNITPDSSTSDTGLLPCPACSVHPHRQACCQNCEDARIAEGYRRGLKRGSEIAFKEINHAGLNELAAITADAIRAEQMKSEQSLQVKK